MGTERERERQGDTERRRKTEKAQVEMGRETGGTEADMEGPSSAFTGVCLLYTSDAADDPRVV